MKLHATDTSRWLAGERGDLFGPYARLHCDLVDLMVGIETPGPLIEPVHDEDRDRRRPDCAEVGIWTEGGAR